MSIDTRRASWFVSLAVLGLCACTVTAPASPKDSDDSSEDDEDGSTQERMSSKKKPSGSERMTEEEEPGNEPSPTDSKEVPGWKLVFDDEFDEPLNETDWTEAYAGTVGQNTAYSPDNVKVENGMLRLKLERRTLQGRPFAGGGIENQRKHSYGEGTRWSVRTRFPAGKGVVGYVGIFGDKMEVDFGEVSGSAPTQNGFTQHSGAEDRQDQSHWTKWDSTKDFHEYSVIWDAGKLTWIVDGVTAYEVAQHFAAQPQGVGLGMGAWANDCGAEGGCPDATTKLPSTMDIDYVRIYRKN